MEVEVQEGEDMEVLPPPFTPAQGCCPCSLCVWGTAFASAESAAERGKRGNGIIRNCTQQSKDEKKLCAACEQEDSYDTEEVYTLDNQDLVTQKDFDTKFPSDLL